MGEWDWSFSNTDWRDSNPDRYQDPNQPDLDAAEDRHNVCLSPGVLVKHYSELIAWKLADDFKQEIIQLLRNSPEASKEFKYRSQLMDATTSVTANIVEGFLRFSPGDFRKFIDYSVASLGEAEARLRDGIALGYFTSQSCEQAFRLARRCLTACIRLKHSQSRIRPRGRRR